MPEDVHPSREELLLAVEGELPAARAQRVQEHLAACWTCRARKLEIDEAIASFIRLRERDLDPLLPPPTAARALLRAHLAQAATAGENGWRWRLRLGMAAAVLAMLVVCVLAYLSFGRHFSLDARVVYRPNRTLTPGVARAVTKEQLCASEPVKNRAVPVQLRRRVFEEYGMPNAEPQAYEVDYLITPALGGADDLRNLWPQSYSSTVWNAQVKDSLEDRLRDLVCEGKLDLTTAQQDIAANWIEAYKRYFHSDRPAGIVQ